MARFEEVLPALREGKKVLSVERGVTLSMDDGSLRHARTLALRPLIAADLMATDWEIVEDSHELLDRRAVQQAARSLQDTWESDYGLIAWDSLAADWLLLHDVAETAARFFSSKVGESPSPWGDLRLALQKAGLL